MRLRLRYAISLTAWLRYALFKVRKREQYIPNPCGYFATALKENWAGEKIENANSKIDTTNLFRYWYDLAKQLGYCSGQEVRDKEQWLQIQADLSLAENTIQAYGKSLEDYLLFCKIYKVIPETAKKVDIATYVRYLSNRPNPRGKNIISLDSGKGLANATMQLRITAIRLFYDHLIEESIRQEIQ